MEVILNRLKLFQHNKREEEKRWRQWGIKWRGRYGGGRELWVVAAAIVKERGRKRWRERDRYEVVSPLVLQPQMGLTYQLLMTDEHEALVE
jgi:hypothetical protein